MDRYSTIRGTIASGAEMRLGASAGLSEFLQSQGALDANSVLQVVDTQLRGFERLAGYEAEMQNQKPVAVRYAPMHLYKMRGMERMRPFCALSVNGVENRADRISMYSQTFVFSHQQMQQGEDGYNYLDMLFGMELLSWNTLELYRKGQIPLECDSPLRKVTPRIEMHDLTIVLKTVEAIYQRKNVIIRLEPDFSFNDRAMSLLAGIYSLLQPRLAVEVGYATYQHAADIVKIVERNSIRIFVLPAEESLNQISENFLILDMAKSPVQVQKTPLMAALVNWIQIPWEQRQSAMQKLFESERDYQDAELFVQKSESFFNDMRSVERWHQDSSRNGTLSSVEELYTEYKAQPGHDIPWFEQIFREKIGKLIGKQTTLDKLNAQTAVKLFTATGEEQQQARKMYLFGRKFGNVDIRELCQLVSAHQKLEDDREHAVEVSALSAELEGTKKEALATLHQVKTAAAAALAVEQENTRRAVEAGNVAVAEEQKKAAAALAVERENTLRALEAGNVAVAEEQKKAAAALAVERENTLRALEAGDAAVAEEQKKAAVALAAEQANTRKAIADGKAALNIANASAAEALAREQKTARIALEAEKANTRKAVEDGEAAVAAEKEKTAAVQQEKERLRAKAFIDLNEEKKRTQEIQTALDQEKELHRQTQKSVRKLEEQNKNLQQSLLREQKNAEDLNVRLNRTNKELADAVGRFSNADSDAKRARADRQSMEMERDAALQAEAAAKTKLDNYIHGKYNKKLIATSGIAGLLAGVVAIGALWLCTSLLNKREKVDVIPPTETVIEAVETNPVVTTQETQVPTMETLPQNRIGTEKLSLLQTRVPMIGAVETENLEKWVPKTLQLENGDVVLALLTTVEVLPEEAGTSEFSYALLIEHNAHASEAAAKAMETAENTDGADGEVVYAPADLRLSTELYDLVVFGDEAMQYAAICAFRALIPEETQASIEWSSDQLLLSELVSGVLEDTAWWRKLESFSLLAPKAESAATPMAIIREPVLYLCCGERWVYVYDCTDDSELTIQLNALKEANACHIVLQGGFAALAATAENVE